jgi:diguanylate cyclase
MPNLPATPGNVIPLRRRPQCDAGARTPPQAEAEAQSQAHAQAEADDDKPGLGNDSFEPRAGQRRCGWLRECAFIALSYAINGVLLCLFAFTGTVHWSAGLMYAGPGFVGTAVIAQLIGSGYSDRFKDPGLSDVHPALSIGLCLLGVAVFPQLVFAYALILFVTFITATYRTSKLRIQVALVVVSLMVALLTIGLGRKLQIPQDSQGEQFIAWLFFLVSLGRCVMLSVINVRNNRLLRERGIQMAAAVAQIERMANHDELTGALNRRRLLQILADEIAHSERTGTPLSVALLDLDHFKAVNDTLGHLAGDKVLQQFASAAQGHTRNTDRFGRYGGEEFLVILSDADAQQAGIAVERLREALLALDWKAIAPALRVTFSAGIASYIPGEAAEALLNRADMGLYVAKHDGRNCTRAA